MRTLLVFALLIAVVAAQFDLCPARAREACASICKDCRTLNGNPVCTGSTTGNECVSPCLDQDLSSSTTLVPTAVSTSPCAYYEVLNTPHEEVLSTRCANVQDDLACDLLGGIFEHQTGTQGETCASFPFLSTIVSGSPCCPEGTAPFLSGGQILCVSNDTSYTGPTLSGTLPVCSLGLCAERPASVIPGGGLVYPEPTVTATCTETCTPTCTPIDINTCDAGCTASCTASCTTDPEATCQATCEASCVASCTPIDATTCTADSCTPFCTASATASFDWVTCPGCAQSIGSSCPTDCSGPGCFDFTSPPTAPVLVSVTDVTVVPGMCVAGICTGMLNTTLVGANTDGEPCAAGACRVAFDDPDLDLTDSSNYPTPTCHPACPGYPSCPTLCPGWPNLADLYPLTRPVVAVADLPDGEVCRLPDACAEAAVCVSSVCEATRSRAPVCERYTCRECAPGNGTCFGPPLPAGTPCQVGCIEEPEGVCDGMGQCIGTPVNASFCRAELGAGVPSNPIDEPCFDIVCTPVDLPYDTATSPEVVPVYSFNGLPISIADPVVVAEDLDRVIVGLNGEFSGCGLEPTFATCDDNDLCTQGETCNEDFLCTPLTETRSGCVASQCAECNPATGQCEGIVGAQLACFTRCGLAGQEQGACDTMTGECVPDFPDPNACQLSSTTAECNLPMCQSGYSGGLIPIDVGELVPSTAVVPSLFTQCAITPRPDGFTCESFQGSFDMCILAEECQSGQCTTVNEVDCSQAFTNNPCVDQNSAQCDSITGQCVFTGFPTGTPCSTGDSCFSNQICINDGVNTPVCTGPLAIDCASLAASNPCILTSVCDGSGTVPECISQFAIDGTSCALNNPGLCAPMGQCDSGICSPVATECPVATQECQVPFCNPGTGMCGFQNAADGSTCDDGLFCTFSDQCDGGVCVGTPIDCTPDECQISLGCSEPAGVCAFSDAPDGTVCTDGFCTGGQCILDCDPPCQSGGTCLSVNPTVCSCPPSRTGQFCQLESTDIMTEAEVAFRDIFTSLLGLLTQFLLWLIIGACVCAKILLRWCGDRPQRRARLPTKEE